MKANKIKKVMGLVIVKMSKGNGSCSINYTGKNHVGLFGESEFFFQRTTDGYTLYQGCELVIGDTTLETCVKAMLQICCE